MVNNSGASEDGSIQVHCDCGRCGLRSKDQKPRRHDERTAAWQGKAANAPWRLEGGASLIPSRAIATTSRDSGQRV